MAVKYGFLLLLHVLTVVQVADAACANSCSGHGRCGASNQCTCDSDWAAPDCSLRKCPTGVAWTDKAKTANVAHAVTECSNRGVCDYSKGECTCFNGYTGAACQRLRCPSDCSGHGLCYSSTTLSLQYGPDSLPSVAGDGIGPVYSNWEKDSMSSCLCDMGYTGPDCSQLMCAKNDDPLTMGQGYRTIQIQVGADALTNLPLAGSVRIHFLGDVAVFNAVAVADAAHEQACAKAFQAMRTVLTATCTIASVDPVTAAATYTVKFTEWTHLGGENNLLHHSGNPALTSFTCDLTQVTSLNTPTCAITDVTATNVIEHIYCSNRGLCDFSTGQCVCYADFKGMDCNQPSNVPDSIDENDGFIVNPMGLTYTGTVLNLKTAKGSQADFYFMKIGSSTKPILTMNGMGNTKLLNGNLEISTGTLTVTTEDQTSTAADIANTHTWFTGTALKVRTTRSSNSGFKMFEAITGTAPTTIVDIRGDGLTTIYKGGLSVVTGGGTISHTSNGPSLTVTNSNSGFSSSLLKLTTSRATRFPGATDFIMIEATANSVSAFTVEASGRTTIASGGLIVNGLGGGKISNSDASAASSALGVSATATTFAGDAVAIKTFSSAAHNMLRVTTEVSSTVVDLVTIDNSGLTTITKGGLDIGSGGATIESGGLRIITGGETIQAGGLIIEDGGETILAGGLNVVDGGGAIASVSSTADVLTVEATSDTFSNNARVLHIDSKSIVDPSVTMHYLIEATVGASSASVFKVDATGLATFAGQSSGGAKISDLGTTANTLTVTNSATGFNKALLALVSTLSSTFSVIEATVGAGATSVFKVASTGLTTTLGLEVTTSGASITGGLKVLGTGASINGGLKVLDTGASISGGLKVLDTGASVNGGLKVLDTGATISGGVTVSNTGLTVTTGGATITDTGTITNTLTVTNSATGFNKALLALVSTATSTFSVIDATVSGTSVFNVLSSGLTTIVGRGSGGAVISDSSPTTTSTLSVTNTAAAAAAFTGAILSVDTTALTEAGAFSIIDARVLGISKFKVEASGKTTIAGGGLTINGGLTVVDTGVTVSAGDVLISSTTPATAVDTGALVVKGGGSIALGLYVGGSLSVVTGGGTISRTSDGSSLTVTNSNSGFSSSLLKLTTSRATRFPGATDFIMIEATANSVSAFTVEASGRTTIASGGLIVNGLGGGKISNSDASAASSALGVSATATTFAGDAVAIKTFSSAAHNMLRVTTEVSSTAVDLVTIGNSGLTTITKGGLDIGSGGATIESGGLRIITGGETIQAGGLNVVDGGGKIASVSSTTDTLAVTNTAAAGAAFTGAVLSVDTTALTDAGGFSLIDARVETVPKFTVAASGKTTIAGGGLDILATGTSVFTVAASGATTIAGGGLSVKGGVTVVDTGVTVSAGDVLISSTTPATAVDTGALVVKGGGSIALGLYVGGSLSVVTGGGTISRTSDGSSLTVTNSNSGFSSSLLKLTTSRATRFPGATDFIMIEATANSVSAFTVEASGRTTIASGGLIVNGLGGGKISNSDASAASSALGVSATATTFAGDAVAIKTFSSAAHNMLRVTTEVSSTAVDLVTIGNSGLTTITKGGLDIGSGGATIESGGLRIITGGETIQAGGLNVVDGGGKIASVSSTTDTLAVTNTAAAGAAFTGAVLSVDTTALTDAGGFSLIDARVKTVPKFTVAASGKTTIAGGGLDILATGTSVFTVAASGATTIAGGGLSVKGGVTVVDTGVTVSAGDVLISSTTPATSTAGALVVKGGGSIALGLYVGGDTKLLGKLEILASGTSIFKVDATGLTTIVGQGSGGATIFDSNAGTTSTLAVANTAAAGAAFTGAVLSVDTTALTDAGGFSLIDARVKTVPKFTVAASGKTTIAGGGLDILATGTSVFTVAASGATTIAGGGLSVKGGVTVVDTGVTVSAGDVLISSTTPATSTAGALVVKGGGSIALGLYVGGDTKLLGKLEILASGTSIFKVDATGLTTIVGQGSGGATIFDSNAGTTSTLAVANTAAAGAAFTGAVLSVDTTALTDAGGFSLIDARVKTVPKFTVAASGKTTIAGGGLDILATGTSVFTVAASGATTIAGGGLSVKGGVTVVDTGVTVSAGDVLISSTTPATSTAGALVVKGGGSIALGLYVGGDTKLLGKLEILASGTSIFKVDATGLTTIVGQGSGGATIFDSNAGTTSTLAVANTAAAGAAFTGAVLSVDTTALTDAGGFSLIDARVKTVPKFTVAASGKTTIAGGGLDILATGTSVFTVAASGATTIAGGGLSVKGGVTVVDTGVTVSAGDVLISSTTPATAVDTGALVVKGGGSIALGLYVGGSLSVVTGGGTISRTSDGSSLTVTNSNSGFSSSLLKLTTSRATRFPGATDFIMIEATANSVSAFTVEASGRTTIASGGLIVNGLGGGKISNSDASAASSALGVSATATTFAGDAVAIKTFSSAAHNMLRVTTEVSSTAVDLVTIGNSGLTTITKGGLDIGSGGATIESGGLRIITGGETIQAGGLNVVDGGGKIASVSSTTDTLAVTNTAAAGAAFTGAVLSVDTTALTDAGGFSLIDARVKTVPKFTVAASGKTTIAGGGLDILATGTSVFTVAASGATTIAGGGLSVKGGVTVVDTGVTVSAGDVLISSTTPATSTAGALVVKGGGSIALGLYVGGDTKLLGKLEILASGTSIFKVDATGLTTIVGQGSGGATIFDSNAGTTSTLAVANTAAAGAAFTGAVLSVDTTALTDAGGFSLIDARVETVPKFTVAASGKTTIAGGGLDILATGTSVFTVAASGATTIAGGGLSVKGGVTVVDTGVTVSAGDVLISSTTPATSTAGALVVKGGGSIALGLYVGGDTKLLGKLEILASGTSIFKVDATGLTTIVGQGSGGATIFDSNAGTTSTLAVANTAAAGAAFTGAVLSVDTTALTDAGGFSLIDARVKTVPKFTVAASGKTTIAGGGLSVKGGVTVVDTGVTVSAGDVLISSTTPATSTAGALVVKGGGSIALGLYVGGDTKLLGKLEILASGTSIFKVDATGLTTIVGQGSGGATIFDSNAGTTSTLAVANTAAAGAAFTGAVLSVDTTALTDAGGFSLIDARVKTVPKFTVAASGKTTIAGGGLDILATGTSVFTVAASGATTIAGGGLSVKGGVTVVDTGVTVSAGDVLISSTTPATSTAGALVVKGGGSIALGLYVGGDTKLLGKLEILASGTSIFKVDATGLTTIVGQGSGGATIFDSNAGTTSTLAVANTAAAGAAFTGAVLSVDTTALTDAGGFSLIDARVKTVPKFTVAASGATTIAGGGLSVKGGVTVVDTGVTVSAGDVLISSTTPATSTAGALVVKGGGSIALGLYVGGDTKLLGKLEILASGTSIFKVDATGLTTIVGQGSGGATIFDSNAGTTSTLAVANTAAAGAAFTGAVLSVDTTALTDAGGFSLIDARVKTVPKFTVAASGKTTIAGGGLDILATGTSVFTVAASGATTIAGGGLSVKGGVTVVDTGVTVSAGDVLISSTTPATSTAGALVVKGGGSIALGLYVGGDTKLLGKLEILASGTSIFKVDATGLTTIVGQGSGGATIFDSNAGTTSTLAVANTAAAGAAFTGAVLSVDTTALTDAGGFSLIDARVKTVPKFTVAASGATTIAGGGLSVKGGVTVVDTGVTVSAGDVLISSTTPATSTAGALVVKGGGSIALGLYVGGDTKLLGKLEILASGTSIFKVDATGLTTIVGQGSGGATIFDSNAGTTSTLAVANTAAAGAAFTGAVLSVDTTALTDAGGFSLIDARVKTVPKFTVAASGATTIAGGGLSVKGGVTVVDTGVTVSAGDVLISSTTPATSTAGALVVKGGGSIALGLYVGGDTKLLGKLEILASGTSIFKVDATGLTTIVGQGSGGATIFDSNAGTTSTLAVANTAAAGAAFTGAVLSVDTTALTDAGGFSLIDARVKTVPKFTVAASGKTTIAGGGLDILATGTSVFTVAASGATTIAGGGLSVKGGVTVVDTGVTVSAGDVLISSTTPATSTAGALVVKGGGSIALGLYVGGDTKLLGKLEILASGTSIFKVDATGLTTIVGQGSGGATIFDSNAGTTSTLAVANTAAAGAAFTGAVLSVDTTALTDAGGFSLIDARVKTVPKFTVAASGATTIAGGGLSVKGGVTVVDTGVTVSAGDVLISSTTPATSTAGALVVKGGGSIALGLYVGGDTKLLGKLEILASGTSIFKVDATGLTTIVGQGSGGATIFDSNAGTTSTLAVANTAAAGAAFTGAVLSVDTTALTDAGGFSLIDARVKTVPKFTVAASGKTTIAGGGLDILATGTSVFTVAASGATTIAGGGLSVKGGVTVVDTGVTVSAGDVLISSTTPATSTAGALVVKGGGSIALGLYVGGDTKLLGKLEILASGTSIFKVDATGLTTIVGQGSGGATIFDSNAGTTSTLAVANTAAAGAAFTGAVLSVDTTALTDAGGFSLIDARVETVPKFTVAASGKTTIAGGGLDILATGTSVFTVAASGATTIAGGGLSVKGGVTVVDTGVTVSAGDVLISSTTEESGVNTGALVVKGGGSFARNLYVGGTIHNTSDRRLKTAVQPLESSWAFIQQLRPVTYEWRRDEFPSRNFPEGVFPGFLADEVEKVLPDLVQEDGSGWKSLNYVGVIPYLVRAVQELQDQVETAETLMARMQQQLDALSKR